MTAVLGPQGETAALRAELEALRAENARLRLTEVTELRRAQAAAETARARLDLALANSAMAVWDWDLASGEVYLSAHWKAMLGETPAETRCSLEALAALAHPEDRPELARAIRAMLKGQAAEYHVEHRVHDAAGDWRWILSRGRVSERDPAGRARRVAGTNVDITRRKSAEEALRESEAQMRMVADNVPVLIAFYDARHVLRFANRSYAALFGKEVDEILGTSAAGLIGEPVMRQIAHVLERVLRGEAATCERLHGEAPGQRHLKVSFVPEREPDGSVGGYVVLIDDITEHRRREEELQRAQARAEAASRAKSAFLANMSHEIRTPMNGILGMTELLLASRLDEEQREYLGMVKSSADALLAIINDILDLSKIEAGKMTLERVAFSLRECLGQVLRSEGLRAREKGLALRAEIAPQVPDALFGDPLRLRQILLNLVSNALKFTRAGYVAVRAVAEPQSEAVLLRLSVEDSGIGIAPDKQAAIFDSFTQAEASTGREFGGTGLGLSICRRLAAMMGGRLELQSEPGRGSVFTFQARFDLAPPAAAGAPLEAAPQAPGAAPRLAGLRVLLAEDNPVNQRLALKLLERLGCTVGLASNGAEAVRLYGSADWDAVLMDVQMPLMDGFQATAQIRALEASRGCRIPVIALTAHALQGDREQCLAAGMDGYLTKPVDSARLAAALEAALPDRRLSNLVPDCAAAEEVLDLRRALDCAGGDRALLAEVARIFVREAPNQLERLARALAAGDARGIEREAHTLKGSLASLGANAARELASALEQDARAGRPAACAARHAQFRESVFAAIAALREFAAGDRVPTG
jgi:PAS domain S-box-containing protein